MDQDATSESTYNLVGQYTLYGSNKYSSPLVKSILNSIMNVNAPEYGSGICSLSVVIDPTRLIY